MEIYQIILIAVCVPGCDRFIVGNTIAGIRWETIDRRAVVGVILGDVQTAMIVGIPL
jgi:mannose/fructose/N-acetylgalactosamine-specific phosphotransferase system component IIC